MNRNYHHFAKFFANKFYFFVFDKILAFYPRQLERKSTIYIKGVSLSLHVPDALMA